VHIPGERFPYRREGKRRGYEFSIQKDGHLKLSPEELDDFCRKEKKNVPPLHSTREGGAVPLGGLIHEKGVFG